MDEDHRAGAHASSNLRKNAYGGYGKDRGARYVTADDYVLNS